MISIDRKVSKRLLQLTKNYDDEILFSPTNDRFILVHDASLPEKSVPYPFSAAEVRSSLDRLCDEGKIRYTKKFWGGVCNLTITAELLHSKAFWWDRFTKTFVAGFISGMATTVGAGLVLHFLIKLF